MPNVTTSDPDREHVGRGALVALAALPIAVALALLPIPLERIWLGAVCLALPFIARFAYTRASGGYLVTGKAAVAAISIAAILLAAVTSNAAIMHSWYVDFGGAGGVLSTDFLSLYPGSLFASPDMFFSLIAAAVTGAPAVFLALITARKPPIRKISETAPA